MFSKSTSTVTGLVLRRDENLNPNGSDRNKFHGTPPANRNVGKDISNSRFLSGKDTGDSVKKKLIIPLEPDLDENDEFMDAESLIRSSPAKSGQLLRKRKVNSKRDYTESPQCSLMKWAKPFNSMQKSDESENIADESACESNQNNNSRVTGNLGPRTRRNQKCSQNPDYLYESLKRKSKKLNSSDGCSESTNEPSDVESNADDEDEEDLDDFVGSRKRRKLCLSPEKEKPKKTGTSSTIGNLKRSKMPLRLSKATQRKKQKASTKTTKKTNTKTIHDFFGQTIVDDNLTQEEKDRIMAERLQKQFEMEAKFQLNSMRFKGTEQQYMLRTSRKRTAKAET